MSAARSGTEGPRRGRLPGRWPGSTLLVTAVWVLLQGEPTPANLLGGLLVGGVLAALWPPAPSMAGDLVLRPLPALRFAAVFARELVVANAVVAREVLTPRDGTRPGIVAVDLGDAPDGLAALVAAVVNLTPGTFVVSMERSPTVLYVHALHLRSPEATRADVRRLHDLAARAFRRAAPVAGTASTATGGTGADTRGTTPATDGTAAGAPAVNGTDGSLPRPGRGAGAEEPGTDEEGRG